MIALTYEESQPTDQLPLRRDILLIQAEQYTRSPHSAVSFSWILSTVSERSCLNE